jgi:predicted metal-binding protein
MPRNDLARADWIGMLTTKRKVIAQVFVCQGCCCGQVERGRPEVPAQWLKEEWRRRGLLKRIQLTISGCLGPCDVPNVVAIVAQQKTVWLGNISRRDQYQSLLDWASRSKDLGRAAEMPKELLLHLLEDPISV